jgi:GNAT superfamily N-acetyltransferase
MNVYAGRKRLGHGTAVMQKIIEWADQQDIYLKLLARPFDHGGIMDTRTLQAFYREFGFEMASDKPRERYMVRSPRRIYTAPNENPILRKEPS